MAWFGKSEAELKSWQDDLNGREKKIFSDEQKMKKLLKSVDDQKNSILKEEEDYSKRLAKLTSGEQDLVKRELSAKNNFVIEQRDVFKEQIEVQIKNISFREEQLNKKLLEFDSRSDEISKKEGSLAERERDIKERELKAENGFADQNLVALRELDKRTVACKSLETSLESREHDVLNKLQSLEERSEGIRKQDLNLQEAMVVRDNGYSDLRKGLDNELEDKRKLFESELDSKRKGRMDELDSFISSERAERIGKLKTELEEMEDELNKKIASMRVEQEDLTKDQVELKKNLVEFDFDKKRNNAKEERLEEREKNIDNDVTKAMVEREKSFDKEVESAKKESARLRDSIDLSVEQVSLYKELERKLGNEDPAAVLLKLKVHQEELIKLRKDLVERPVKEVQDTYEKMEKENDKIKHDLDLLKEENLSLRKDKNEQSSLELKIDELEMKNKSVERKFELVDCDNKRMDDELSRLKGSYKRGEERDSRINDIELPCINKSQDRASEVVDELEWLEEINISCLDYGIKFPRRILHAFHTSLKTSEWSPITVLAGVSGTGKSELPRLYSHFGGVNFINLSVQPNWDSQESMLGFFNSIDNKFDAQPVLRLLAQSQKEKTKEYPYGLKDTMNIILLDEMNLAYVELYFAEFLSKFELRRGKKGEDVPRLEVKLGAGIQPYELAMGRNVLWVGTMNQDETTKSLSDKVLDRGIIINFPRPTTLERRKELKQLESNRPLLPRKQWNKWLSLKSSFSEKQISTYKLFVENMNDSLSKVGRALGHRVWQSIEYYMSNYPDVRKALADNDEYSLEKSMRMAFEDQLVQKVMPKLRGIETRGKSKSDCLDVIRALLVGDDYAIVDDFDLACEFGYGQFIWNSANYLKEEESEPAKEDENVQKEK